MTGNRCKGPDLGAPQDALANGAVGPARRRAIAALVAEDFDAFAHARLEAQRKLVHSLESLAAAAEIRRCHFRFVVQAAHDYAEQASRFDTLVDELGAPGASEL
jgi:hypothetical protein